MSFSITSVFKYFRFFFFFFFETLEFSPLLSCHFHEYPRPTHIEKGFFRIKFPENQTSSLLLL